MSRDSIGRDYNETTGDVVQPAREAQTPILNAAVQELKERYETSRAAQDDARFQLREAQNHYDDCTHQRDRLERAFNEIRGAGIENDVAKAKSATTMDVPSRNGY